MLILVSVGDSAASTGKVNLARGEAERAGGQDKKTAAAPFISSMLPESSTDLRNGSSHVAYGNRTTPQVKLPSQVDIETYHHTKFKVILSSTASLKAAWDTGEYFKRKINQ